MSIEAMKQALTHEIDLVLTDPKSKLSAGAQRALHYVHRQIQAIAEAEKQEPFMWLWEYHDWARDFKFQKPDEKEANSIAVKKITPLYTHQQPAQPKREWVGLTTEEILNLGAGVVNFEYAKAIEAKLKEKNT